MLDAILPNLNDDDLNTDVQGYLQRAEEARQLSRVRTTDEPLIDAGRYNLRRRDAEYHPGDLVSVGPQFDDAASVRSFCVDISDRTEFYDGLRNLSTQLSLKVTTGRHDNACGQRSSTWFASYLTIADDGLYT